MKAGWVAAGVRGVGLSKRRLGEEAARQLARAASLNEAIAGLAATTYGRELRRDMDLVTAERAVQSTAVWHLRVLAGWGPPLGGEVVRIMAGGFEIDNVTDHLSRLAGRDAAPPIELGSLTTAWPRASTAVTVSELRGALRDSAWGDPGTDDPAGIRLALELAWARRAYDGVEGVGDLAISGAAVVIARVLGADARSALSDPACRSARHLLGSHWDDATSLAALAGHLPPVASAVLADVRRPEDLWRAKVRWWAAVESTANALLAQPLAAPAASAGVAAALIADTARVRSALALAASGGGELAEVTGALA